MAVDEYFSRLTEMLQRIADVLPRYRIYTELFSKHETLQKAISQVYLAVETFVFEAAEVFESSRRVLTNAAWKGFDQKFEGSLNELRTHAEKVERAADVAHMIEESNARNDLKADLSSVKAQLDQLQLTISLGEQSA